MKIEQVTDAETADACDELLTKLITDERETYNSNIPSDFTVSGWYRTTLSNTSRVTFAAVEAQQVVGFLHGFIKDDPAIQPEARLDAVFVEPADSPHEVILKQKATGHSAKEAQGALFFRFWVCCETSRQNVSAGKSSRKLFLRCFYKLHIDQCVIGIRAGKNTGFVQHIHVVVHSLFRNQAVFAPQMVFISTAE